MKCYARALGLSILLAMAVWAADISGKWEATVDTSAGSGSPSFVFKQEGEKLTGDYSGALGKAKLAGTVKGDKVEFSFRADAGGEALLVEYKGTLEAAGKSMKGAVKLGSFGEGTFKATRQ